MTAQGRSASRPSFASWMGQTNDITRMFLAASAIPDLVNLAGGLPEAETYPVLELAKIAEEAVRVHSADALNYPPIDGFGPLRDAIAQRYSRGDLRLTRANVLITAGGMQGIELIGKVLVDQGQTIACQSPAYLGAIDGWRPRLPQLRPMHFESNDFDAKSALAGAQFAYVVPNFSNPTGRLVSLAEREALVEASRETGTWLVEDDPYGALYYDSAPLPRMIELSAQAEDEVYQGNVIYMGTLSKELAPGLRIGWVIAAPEMIEALATAKQGSDLSCSGLSQRIAFDAIEAGLIEQIRPNILSIYAARRDALHEALLREVSEWFTWEKPVGGMFLWLTAKDPAFDTTKLLEIAMKAGVCISPSEVFDPLGIDRRSMRLNFTYNAPDRLALGAHRLAEAVRVYLKG